MFDPSHNYLDHTVNMTAVQLAPLAKHIYHSILLRCDELPKDVIRTVAGKLPCTPAGASLTKCFIADRT